MSLKWECLRLNPALECRKDGASFYVRDKNTGLVVGRYCHSAGQAWWHAYAEISPFRRKA